MGSVSADAVVVGGCKFSLSASVARVETIVTWDYNYHPTCLPSTISR